MAVRLGVADAAAAVAAHVVEAAQLSVLAADHEHALADDVGGEEVARLSGLVGAANVDPFAEEHLLPLELEDLGSVVVAARKCRPTCARHGHM